MRFRTVDGVFIISIAAEQIARPAALVATICHEGYLSEEELAYALACYAWLRGESDPSWRRHLARNITPYFNDAVHFIATTGDVSLLRDASRDAEKASLARSA